MEVSITVFPTADDASLCSLGSVAKATFASLADIVTKQAWSAGTFKGNYRKNENFMQADFIALDVDGGCSLAEALGKHLKGLKYIVYTSRNHLKDKGDGVARDRFRIILALDRPIITPQEYKVTWGTLHKRFPFIDEKAKDPARLFFPGRLQEIKLDGEPVKVMSCLSLRTNRFLTEGASAGNWNNELYIATKDIQEQLYTQEQAEELLTRPTLLPGNSGSLDEKDLQTIASAFRSPPTNPPRQHISFMRVNGKGKEKLDLDQLAIDLLSPNFVLQVNNETTMIYRVEDQVKKEIGLCKNKEFIERFLTQEIEELKKAGLVNLSKGGRFGGEYSMSEILHTWRLTAPAISDPPAPFGWPEDTNWVIKRLDFSPIKGEHKAWDEFLDRISDKEAFMAWVWSCFELKNRSRQAIWLYGPEGQDGKSTVMNVLSDCFGQAAAGLNNTQIRSDSRFVFSNFYNKRLIVYPDAKNTKFPMTEIFRSLTSGDIVPIEFKGEGTVNVRLYVKLMIASNQEPEVTLGGADLSRLIRIDIEPSSSKDDPQWEDRLIKELPEFLGSCKEIYEKNCPHHGQVRVSEKTRQLSVDSANEMHEHLQELFDKHFELAPDEVLPATVLRNTLAGEEDQLKNFKRFLLDKYKVKRVRVRNEEGRPTVYEGIRLKKKPGISNKVVVIK